MAADIDRPLTAESRRHGDAGLPPHRLLGYRQLNVWAATTGAPVVRKTSCSVPGELGVQLSETTEWLAVSLGAAVIEGITMITTPRLSVRIHSYDTVPPAPLVVKAPVAVTVPFRQEFGLPDAP